MSKAGLNGLQLATADIVTVARSLTADEWKMPSAAQGWSVHDVVSHAGNLLTVVMDAVNGQLVTPDGMGIEALNECKVAEHRSWDPLETVDFLEEQLAKAVQVFTPLQDEPYASTEAELLDLGSYPLHADRRHVHIRLHYPSSLRHPRTSWSDRAKHGAVGRSAPRPGRQLVAGRDTEDAAGALDAS